MRNYNACQNKFNKRHLMLYVYFSFYTNIHQIIEYQKSKNFFSKRDLQVMKHCVKNQITFYTLINKNSRKPLYLYLNLFDTVSLCTIWPLRKFINSLFFPVLSYPLSWIFCPWWILGSFKNYVYKNGVG